MNKTQSMITIPKSEVNFEKTKKQLVNINNDIYDNSLID